MRQNVRFTILFRHKHVHFLKTTFHFNKARVCPFGVGATFAAVFLLIYRLREFPLSAVISIFELRCQLNQLLLLYYQNLSFLLTPSLFLQILLTDSFPKFPGCTTLNSLMDPGTTVKKMGNLLTEKDRGRIDGQND